MTVICLAVLIGCGMIENRSYYKSSNFLNAIAFLAFIGLLQLTIGKML